MNKKSMALSISFPLLSIIVSGILINLFHMDSVFIITLGIICGGVLPMFIIVFLKADVSKFFVGKIVLFIIFFIGIFFHGSYLITGCLMALICLLYQY